ncbi:MAG: hypothetical protein ABMA26_08055 [Limisphaerales bacterium]
MISRLHSSSPWFAFGLAVLLVAAGGCRRSNRAESKPSVAADENIPPPIVPAPPVAASPGIPANAALQDPALAPTIKKAVERYFNEQGQAPYSCQDLVLKKYLATVPLAQNGQPLDLNLFLAHHNAK